VIATERDMRRLLNLLGMDEETIDLIIANAEDENEKHSTG
jgi:ferritin-like protein